MPSKEQVILLVDDDDGARRTLAAILLDAGYQVIDIADAMRALELLEGEGRIDLLITDALLRSSQPNGVALANMAMLKRPNLPVIFVAHDPATVEHIVDRQTTPLLAKPVPAASLRAKVRAILARTGGK